MQPEYVHFRCAWHAVEGHFEQAKHAAYAKCEAIGCKNRGIARWYRGEQFAKLPTEKAELIAYG